MEENKNYKKIVLANRIRLFSIIILFCCIWEVILEIHNNDIYGAPFCFILLFADIAVYCIMTYWRNWIILEKCDFQAQEKSVLSLLKRKRYKESIILHKDLLFTSLVLGKYDESRREIDELHRLDSRLKPAQRLEVQLYNIDYMISVNETESLDTALENAENALQKLSGKSDRVKQKYQRGIRYRQYLIEERWEDLLKLLKEISKKNITMYEQVNTAYHLGQCFYYLGRYEEAFYELKFAAKYGGNTKYVMLANDLIEKILEKDLYLYENKSAGQSKKVKPRIDKTVIIFAISCLLLLLSIGFYHYCSHGNSIEEAYCRRYFCARDDITIIYQKKIDNYELVILYDEGSVKNVTYCLFEETDSEYKIIESFRFDRNLEKNYINPFRTDLTEREKEFYRKNIINGEIWLVFADFYKKNNIFYQEDMIYVGICSLPIAENIAVNGNTVNFEEVIYIGETAFYIWSVENVNLKSNIHVDYVVE